MGEQLASFHVKRLLNGVTDTRIPFALGSCQKKRPRSGAQFALTMRSQMVRGANDYRLVWSQAAGALVAPATQGVVADLARLRRGEPDRRLGDVRAAGG